MRALVPLFLTLGLLSGCLFAPTPTPVAVFQYPPTWTPAPTPTFTALPPTATLVIQRTPGAVQTRDPKVRILPSAPRSRPGLWMGVSSQSPAILQELVRRANIVVTDNTTEFTASLGALVFLSSASVENASEPLNHVFAGIVITPTAEFDAEQVRAAIQPKLLLISTFLTETVVSDLDPAIDGVRLENFLTEPKVPLSQFPDEAEWVKELGVLSQLSANPNLVVLTSTRLGEDAGDGSVSTDQWLAYALASFLLGNNGTRSYFGMESALTPQSLDSSLFELEIGTPLGNPFKQSGIYQRRFTEGLVLVNPTKDARAVTLSRNYVDGFGTRYNSVEIQPHTGMILLTTE